MTYTGPGYLRRAIFHSPPPVEPQEPQVRIERMSPHSDPGNRGPWVIKVSKNGGYDGQVETYVTRLGVLWIDHEDRMPSDRRLQRRVRKAIKRWEDKNIHAPGTYRDEKHDAQRRIDAMLGRTDEPAVPAGSARVVSGKRLVSLLRPVQPVRPVEAPGDGTPGGA